MNDIYRVHEEVYLTNPPRHAGWVVVAGEERRFVSAHASRDEAEEEARRRNDVSEVIRRHVQPLVDVFGVDEKTRKRYRDGH